MDAHHIAREFAHSFLFIVSDVVLLQQLIFEMFEVKINIEVFEKTAVANFLHVGVMDVEVVQTGLTLHEGHVGHHFYMAQHRSVETFGVLLLLADEDVLAEEVLKGDALFCLPFE